MKETIVFAVVFTVNVICYLLIAYALTLTFGLAPAVLILVLFFLTKFDVSIGP